MDPRVMINAGCHKARFVEQHGGERALRPSIIQRNVTNGYRSKWAADAEADLRTTVDTARLSGANPFRTIFSAVSA